MWLLNARTRQLEYFNDSAAVRQGYAILSHVWSGEEVIYQDLTCLEAAKNKKGYRKLDSTCRRALEDGFEYVWIDTCCIDKTSSAELSEAINSMFKWYKCSAICYVYLQDKSVSDEFSLRSCRWFTRGWTLQELIASPTIHFYDKDWSFIGTKKRLCSKLERYTAIPEYILLDCGYLDIVSVAKKMSWASARRITRLEDISYCLLGIFDVNMPLLYGEGPKAFHRLLEAIMRRTTDHSILVWQPSMETTAPMAGLLASSPANYSNSGRVMQYFDRIPDAYEMNNVGIRMNMPVFSDHGQRYILLDCRYEDDFSGIIGLEVELISAHTDNADGLMILRRGRGVRLFDIEQAEQDLLSLRTQILLVPYDYLLKGKTEDCCHGLKIWLQ